VRSSDMVLPLARRSCGDMPASGNSDQPAAENVSLYARSVKSFSLAVILEEQAPAS